MRAWLRIGRGRPKPGKIEPLAAHDGLDIRPRIEPYPAVEGGRLSTRTVPFEVLGPMDREAVIKSGWPVRSSRATASRWCWSRSDPRRGGDTRRRGAAPGHEVAPGLRRLRILVPAHPREQRPGYGGDGDLRSPDRRDWPTDARPGLPGLAKAHSRFSLTYVAMPIQLSEET